MINVNDSYFEGRYKDIWRQIIPPGFSEKEVDFLITYFSLKPGDSVLDLMCGYGRHCLPLARFGINVTAVDNLKNYTDEIEHFARDEKLNIEVLNAGVLDIELQSKFNLVILMGNSLNFFRSEDVSKMFANVSTMLKKGGYFVINTWSLDEIVHNTFVGNSESVIGDVVYKTSSEFLAEPRRIESTTQMIAKDGSCEQKLAIDYILSIPQIENLLNEVGLKLKEIFSTPPKKIFKNGDLKAYIIAQKESN